MTKEGAELLLAHIQQGELRVETELDVADVCNLGGVYKGYKVKVTLKAGQRIATIKNAVDWLAIKRCWLLIAKGD